MHTSTFASRFSLFLLAFLAISGCGAEKNAAGVREPAARVGGFGGALSEHHTAFERSPQGITVLDSVDANRAAGEESGIPPADKGVARKIRYTADVEVVVEDFQPAEQALKELVKKEGGYISQTEVSGSPGTPRRGKCKVRIPVERFEAFTEAIAKLGELQRHGTNSQDVTEEYYDLEARIRNKKAEEEELLKLQQEGLARLQKEPKAKLEDLQSIRRELSQVRGEIERMQGRVKLLADLTELTTVTVTIHERKGYVPPTAPEFGTTVSRTFGESLGVLVDFGKGLLLVAVAVAPWLPIILIAGVPLVLFVRRLRRHSAATPTSA